MKSTKQLLGSLVNIINDAGGEVIGYNRFQYTIYLLQITGLDDDFTFFYKQNELYCEELNSVLNVAKQLNYIREDQNVAAWGGVYYTYRLLKETNLNDSDDLRKHFIQHLLKIDAEMLDVITTATYLHNVFDNRNPWDEIKKTKLFSDQNKVDEYLLKAKKEYNELKSFIQDMQGNLPDIA